MLRPDAISFLASPSARYIRRTLNLLMKGNVFLLLSCGIGVLLVRSQKRTRTDYTHHTNGKNNTYLHHSSWWAFVNKGIDAKLSVAEMEKNDEAGLGSFNVLNG